MTKVKKEFSFPPEEEIKKVIKRTTQPGYRRVNQGLWPNATTEDKVKHNLCKSILRYLLEKKLTEEELTRQLGIDQVETEYILFCHYKKLTLKKLTHYIDKLPLSLEVKTTNHYDKQTTARTH